MKFSAIIEYGQNRNKVKSLHPAHREYLRSFLENGQLGAAGPFANDAGALWILDGNTLETVEEIVEADPYVASRVIVGWQICPLAYWSAQEAKGAR